jgi:hypothetical protein
MSCDNVNSGPSNPAYVAIGGTNTDAFGRLRVSQPYTLFDSQIDMQQIINLIHLL